MVFWGSSLLTAEEAILKLAGSSSAAPVAQVDATMHKKKTPAERLNPGLASGTAFLANRSIRSV